MTYNLGGPNPFVTSPHWEVRKYLELIAMLPPAMDPEYPRFAQLRSATADDARVAVVKSYIRREWKANPSFFVSFSIYVSVVYFIYYYNRKKPLKSETDSRGQVCINSAPTSLLFILLNVSSLGYIL